MWSLFRDGMDDVSAEPSGVIYVKRHSVTKRDEWLCDTRLGVRNF